MAATKKYAKIYYNIIYIYISIFVLLLNMLVIAYFQNHSGFVAVLNHKRQYLIIILQSIIHS